MTKLRHASKNDKKKKKEIIAQIAELEAALKQRHELEKKEFYEENQEVILPFIELSNSVIF